MSSRPRRRLLAPCLIAGLVATAFLGAAPPDACARFLAPTAVPVDRLVKNVTAFVAKHPSDAHGYYVLGRVHSLALVYKSPTVQVYLDQRNPDTSLPSTDHTLHRKRDEPLPTVDVLQGHLREALAAFATSLKLDPKSAATHLGLAYTCEAGATFQKVAPPGFDPEAVVDEATTTMAKVTIALLGIDDEALTAQAQKTLISLGVEAYGFVAPLLSGPHAEHARHVIGAWWNEAAIQSYLAAYDLAIKGDLALEHLPVRGLKSLVAHEAGVGYLKFVKARGVKPREASKVAQIETGVKALKQKRRNKITPIVFPMGQTATLASLLAPDRTATFDLDGDGLVEEWPWVGPDTGILVWDPAHTGRITSGRQLFGSVTWWMFWRNGYKALAALDDDGDGWLAGSELEGIAVWRDLDGNGASCDREVMRLETLGITAIAAHATGFEGDAPMHAAGIRRLDGTTVPTFDWTTSSTR